MRNLVEYPITPVEVIECLQELCAERKRSRLGVGDMHPLLLLTALQVVKDAYLITQSAGEGSASKELLVMAFRSQNPKVP